MSKETVVVVTGASGGIGQMICSVFAESETSTVPVAVHGFDVEPAPTMLKRYANYTHHVVDVRDADTLETVVSDAAFPNHVDHLVTCAGIALPEESQNEFGRGMLSPDVFKQSVDLNLIGHYNALWAVYPKMLRSPSRNRSVTFVSSINAIQSFGLPGYSSAKAGLQGLTVSLAVPLGHQNIRINTILPGTTPTPNTLKEWEHEPNHWDRMKEGTPLGKLGTPKDVASTIYHLASSLTHITGTSLVVDGGQHINR